MWLSVEAVNMRLWVNTVHQQFAANGNAPPTGSSAITRSNRLLQNTCECHIPLVCLQSNFKGTLPKSLLFCRVFFQTSSRMSQFSSNRVVDDLWFDSNSGRKCWRITKDSSEDEAVELMPAGALCWGSSNKLLCSALLRRTTCSVNALCSGGAKGVKDGITCLWPQLIEKESPVCVNPWSSFFYFFFK